jgi:microcystin-dependent protein
MGLISPDIPGLNTGETEATAQPKVTNALQEIVNLLNGALDSANLAPGSITADRLAFSLQASFLPAGIVIATAGASADSGFLLCDGSAVSRDTYSNLFAKIGTRWGVGDGVSTFNLPNLNTPHRTLIGADGTTIAVGATGGAETVALTTAEMPDHEHLVRGVNLGGNPPNSNDGIQILGSQFVGAGGTNYTIAITQAGSFNWGLRAAGGVGGNGAHSNMQPWAGVLYQVKT